MLFLLVNYHFSFQENDGVMKKNEGCFARSLDLRYLNACGPVHAIFDSPVGVFSELFLSTEIWANKLQRNLE